MNDLSVVSFFSGIGGIDMAFEQNGFKTIYANDIDSNACKTFDLNFDIKSTCKDIHNVSVDEIPDTDCLIGGFPCQAFSVAGYRKGFDDARGTLFFEVARILKHKKIPIILLENVKNLVNHDKGKTFRVILSCLEELGYNVKYAVLNACAYGNIPQNRERVYIVGFLNKDCADNFEFPKEVPLTTKLSDCIDFENVVDEKFYYTPEKYPKIVSEILSYQNTNAIYQWRRHYIRQNKSGVCPTLTANMGTGGHNVPLITTKYGVRKLMPKECLNLQGFPKDYQLPEISWGQLYKQAGNSVCVSVISRIAKNILDAVK